MPVNATTLYISSTTADVRPADGTSLSIILPEGTNNSGSAVDTQSLTLSFTEASSPVEVLSLGQTALQSGRMGKHSSPTMKSQTIGAGNWTFNIDMRESNGQANTFCSLSLYAYRPSTTSRVGIIAEQSSIGIEVSTGVTSYVLTGSSLAVTDGDILVLEIWYSASQGMNTTYTNTYFVDSASYTVVSPAAISYYTSTKYYYCT